MTDAARTHGTDGAGRTGRPESSTGRSGPSSGQPSGPGQETAFWALRHGESLANVDGVIVSRPGPRAQTEVGLTERGLAQARRAAEETRLGPDTVLVTSDFARARQTAQAVAEVWGAATPLVDTRLRERDFGSLDEGPDTAYESVWAADHGEASLPAGVETVEEVAARTRSLVRELAQRHPGADVVLVAHGDVLQITQAWTAGRPPAEHRSLPHLGNAELRRLLPRQS